MRTSWISYGILVSFMVAMKLVIMVARWDVDGFAVVFSWPWLLGVSTAGVLGVLASRPAGFASMWTPKSAFVLGSSLPLLLGFHLVC
jgi:hypothetical protein